jgi:hypothetical protein
VLGPILHWLQPGFKAEPVSGAKADPVLKSAEPSIASYLPPTAPLRSAPHRYVFFLYEQRPAFDVGDWRYAPKPEQVEVQWFGNP